ncbi:hypothetical protein [Niabella hibiscisoli]|uniref:hypothetical protein n=1 Tax=Niabella hibiscisoli TaxID=1825928 RepID=UPI001F10BCB8|nr:hypothetical protein [Niabella hibiscisoli]MCH5719404.1 hypothetical protein [Niabella hibiscisoli]
MNKDDSMALSFLKVTLNGEELILSNVFVTGDAIPFWQAEKQTLIDLASWYWYRDTDREDPIYIVTERKALG